MIFAAYLIHLDYNPFTCVLLIYGNICFNVI